ncbi:MAG: FAD binding domain-containing protein [Gaiellales bacterium]
MKAAVFDLQRPATLDEALALLQEHGGDARLLAGGQSLVPMLHMRLVQPAVVVDLERIEGLAGLSLEGDGVRIGAMTRYAALERDALIAERLPLLATAMRCIGDRQVRNRGTIGGSLAQADPLGEMPLICLALDAAVILRSSDGERAVPIDDFLLGAYTTELEEDEMIVAVHVPFADRRCVLHEITRRHNDFAVLALAATAVPSGDGSFADVRVAIAGMDDRALLAEDAMRELEGSGFEDDRCAQAASLCAAIGDPLSDVRASADYRRQLASVHGRRTFTRIRTAEGALGV